MTTLLLALMLQAAAPEKAEHRPWRDVEITLGGYLAAVDTSIDVQTDAGIGGKVDFEDLLGLDSSILSFRLGASVALGERHRLYFDMFDLSRKASTRLGRDIEFNGTVYPVGSDIDSKLSLQIFNLSYGYSFLQDDRIDLAVTLGIHGLRTAVSLDSASGAQEDVRFFLPIPLPGLRMDIALTPSLWLRQRYEFLWLGTQTYQGLMTDISFCMEWAFIEHVAVGVGYNTIRTKLSMKSDQFPAVSFRGEFDFEFSGLQFYLQVFF